MEKLHIEYQGESFACDYQEEQLVEEVIETHFLPTHSDLELTQLLFFERLDEVEIPMAQDDFLYFLDEPRLIIRAIEDEYSSLAPIQPCFSLVDLPVKSTSPSSDSHDLNAASGDVVSLAKIVAAHSSVPEQASKLVKKASRLRKGLDFTKSSVFSALSGGEYESGKGTPVYIEEQCSSWFTKTFEEYGKLVLAPRLILTDLEAMPLYAGFPGTVTYAGPSFGEEVVYEIVVGRSLQGGWIFTLGLKDEPNLALVLPICTKFQIVLYQNTNLDLKLPADFLQQVYDGESDKEVQTFVIQIESYELVCDASISAMAELHKILSIAYEEVVGGFSENIATDKPYGKLAGNRVQSCRLAKKIVGAKMQFKPTFFGLDIAELIERFTDKPQSEQEFFATELAMDLLFSGKDDDFEAVVERVASFVKKLDADADAYDVEDLKNYRRCTETIYEKLLEYPSHNRYAAFNAIADPTLRFRGQMLAISCFESDAPAALPVELAELKAEAVEEGTLREDAMQRYFVNACMISFDEQNRLFCDDDFIIPFKAVVACNETVVNFSSKEWTFFEQFLPYFLATDDDWEQFPEPYLGVLKAFKFLEGDVGLTVGYVKTFCCIKNNLSTYLVCAFIPSTSTMGTDYKSFFANIQANYGECESFANIERYFSRARCVGNKISGDHLIFIAYRHQILQDTQVLVENNTGLPYMCAVDGGTNQAIEQLQARVGAELELFEQEPFEIGEARLFVVFPKGAVATADVGFETLPVASIWLIRQLYELQYYELAELYYDTLYPKYNICVGDVYDHYDHIEDEEFEYDLSMSDEKNNVHPYRGPVDEYNEDNEELANALYAIQFRQTQQELANERIFDYGHEGVSVLLQFYIVAELPDSMDSAVHFKCSELTGDLEKDMPDFCVFGNEKLLCINSRPTDIADLTVGEEIYVADKMIVECDSQLSDFLCKKHPDSAHFEPVFDELAVEDDCSAIRQVTRELINQTWTRFYDGLRIPKALTLPASAAVNSAKLEYFCLEATCCDVLHEPVHEWFNSVVWQAIERFRELAELNADVAQAVAAAGSLVSAPPAPTIPVRETDAQKIERIKREMGIDEQLQRLLGE